MIATEIFNCMIGRLALARLLCAPDYLWLLRVRVKRITRGSTLYFMCQHMLKLRGYCLTFVANARSVCICIRIYSSGWYQYCTGVPSAHETKHVAPRAVLCCWRAVGTTKYGTINLGAMKCGRAAFCKARQIQGPPNCIVSHVQENQQSEPTVPIVFSHNSHNSTLNIYIY